MPAKLTTHVLDTAHGCPARGMLIELWSVTGAARRLLKAVRTNADGRTDEPLLDASASNDGEFELVFFVGDYFAARMGDSPERRFLDRVPVRFGLAPADGPCHVPLLCTPWAYSTYRGS